MGWGGDRERLYADHIIQIYFRVHHFVLKFSKLFRLRRQQGIDPPNQNPADAVAVTAEHCESAAVEVHDHRPMVDLTNV